MKKLFLLIIIAILFLFSSCGTYGLYRGEYPYLYTQTTNSLLGTGSYDPNIKETIYIIETDEYGRKLFLTIDGANFSGALAVLGICQKSDKNNVYYYPEINYIQKLSTDGYYIIVKNNNATNYVEKYFTEEEISQLKEKNDWGEPLDNEKYIKKEIYRKKPELKETEEIENAVKKHYQSYFAMLNRMSTAEFIQYLYDNDYISKDQYTSRTNDADKIE